MYYSCLEEWEEFSFIVVSPDKKFILDSFIFRNMSHIYQHDSNFNWNYFFSVMKVRRFLSFYRRIKLYQHSSCILFLYFKRIDIIIQNSIQDRIRLLQRIKHLPRAMVLQLDPMICINIILTEHIFTNFHLNSHRNRRVKDNYWWSYVWNEFVL